MYPTVSKTFDVLDLADSRSIRSKFRDIPFQVEVESTSHLASRKVSLDIKRLLKESGCRIKGPVSLKGRRPIFSYRHTDTELSNALVFTHIITVSTSNYRAIDQLIRAHSPSVVNITIRVLEDEPSA